jgi:hypothetical protein
MTSKMFLISTTHHRHKPSEFTYKSSQSLVKQYIHDTLTLPTENCVLLHLTSSHTHPVHFYDHSGKILGNVNFP